MKKLKRSECAILPLVLKGKWYDMIKRGEKREEYRDETSYWAVRLLKWGRAKGVHAVEFRRGYAKNAPRMAFAVHVFHFTSGKHFFYRQNFSDHPGWGEPSKPHFVIVLDDRVELEDEP